MYCFHLWVKNTARGICSAWGNLVNFWSTFPLKANNTSLFEWMLTMSLKYSVWSHFCNALKSTSHFPYRNMLWEGKRLDRAVWWNLDHFFSTFPLKTNNTSPFEWMSTMSLKYSVFKTDPFIFLPKRCCVFYPQIETLRLLVWPHKVEKNIFAKLSRCFLPMIGIQPKQSSCRFHSNVERLSSSQRPQ